MKTIFLFTFLICVSITVSAQIPDTLFLWPDEVPGSSLPKNPPVQTPDTSRGIIRLTNITNPLLEVFESEASHKNGGALIIAPGGAYQYLAYNFEGTPIAKWLNTLGYTAFVLQYRTPDKELEALYDIQRAIRVVRGNAEKWGIDTDKIGVIGFSAGGSLSARASTRFEEDLYDHIDELDKISARPDFAILIYPAYLDRGRNKSLTPEITLDVDVPPIFIFATVDDPYTSSSLVFAKALYEEGLKYELHVYPEGGHGFGLRKGNSAAETWPGLVEQWLKNILN